MQGLATGLIPLTPKLEMHLDGCLSCRACESVCPANVPYGQLIDAGRLQLAQRRGARTRFTRLLGFALTHRRTRQLLAALLWLYQRMGLQALVHKFHLLGRGPLARLESLLPVTTAQPLPQPDVNAATALFVGCMGQIADSATLRDSIRVLQRIGVPVQIPRAQTCCGALHLHGGLRAQAQALAERNLAAFAGAETVLSAASGCGAQLIEYGELLGTAEGERFAGRTRDVTDFVAQNWPQSLVLKPLRARVAVHLPCTHRNVMGGGGAILELLRKIPQAEVFELDRTQRCCGAAGSYFITQPEMADRLLVHKLDAANSNRADILVSSNVGCSLHLAAGLRRAGSAIEVLHPLSLLARLL
jgi:glycolate oxidase iron-sulfur subunit